MALHEKARVYNLYACQAPLCPVMTFIRSVECPSCGTPGVILRFADTLEKGQPPDPRYRSFSDSGPQPISRPPSERS